MTDYYDERVLEALKHKLHRVGHKYRPDRRAGVRYVERQENGRRYLAVVVELEDVPDYEVPGFLRRDRRKE